MGRAQGRFPEFAFDGQAQARGLLVQETAGSGGAQGTHREILEPEAAGVRIPFQLDILGILPSDIDDGTDMGIGGSSRFHLGDHLVHARGSEPAPEPSGAGARDGGPGNHVIPLDLLQVFREHPVGPAVVTAVAAVPNPPLGVQDHDIHADRSHVDTQQTSFPDRHHVAIHRTPPLRAAGSGGGRKPTLTQ